MVVSSLPPILFGGEQKITLDLKGDLSVSSQYDLTEMKKSK